MNSFQIKIAPEALADIQDITSWYNEQREGLGRKFQLIAIRQINNLSENPYVYALRYNQIRCMLLKRFPYMVHFYINEQTKIVEVLAVFSTDRNPENWIRKQTATP